MKRTFITLICLLGILSFAKAQEEETSSQFSKGTNILGGSISGYFTQSEPENNISSLEKQEEFSIAVAPNIGFFGANNFMVILKPQFGYRKVSSEDSRSIKAIFASTSLGLGAELRYFLPQKIFFHLGPDIVHTIIKSDYPSNNFDSESRITSLVVTGGLGYAWFIKQNIALEPKLSYAYSTALDKNSALFYVKQRGINFSLGLQFYLSKQ